MCVNEIDGLVVHGMVLQIHTNTNAYRQIWVYINTYTDINDYSHTFMDHMYVHRHVCM